MYKQVYQMYFTIQFVVLHISGEDISLNNMTVAEQDVLQDTSYVIELATFQNEQFVKPERVSVSSEMKNNNNDRSKMETISAIDCNVNDIMDRYSISEIGDSIEENTRFTALENNEIDSGSTEILDDGVIQDEKVLLPSENEFYIKNYMKILYHEFQDDNCLIIPYNKTWVNWAIQLTKVKTIIDPDSKLQLMTKLRKFDTYITVITTIQEIKHFLLILFGTPNWSYRAKYLLIYLGKSEDIEEIFPITWKYFLLNLTILTTHGMVFEMYTHFPYMNGSCGSNLIPVKLNNISNIFPQKIELDMKGCTLKLMGLNIKPYVLDINEPKDEPTKAGLEVTVIHNVLKRLNFTEEYVSNPYPHWGYMLPDGNFTMTFKELYDKRVDIIFGMIIGNETMEEHFDTTVSHIDTAAVWFVPTSSQIAQWKNLTVIFDGIVWSSIFFVFILNAFSWWILGRKRETSASYNELSLCLMGAFYILLQGSFTTAKAWKLRFIVIIWSFASLLMFTAHQCQLTGILTSPLYEHQISDLKELVESNLDYGFYPILKELYSDPTNWVHKKILHNFKQCSLTTECMNRTAFKRDFALIKNKRQGAYLMPIYYSFPSGKPKLYTFKEAEFVVWCKYYVPRGFPFVERIDKLIMLLLANGLVAKWDGDLSPGVKQEDDPELEPLSLNHLQGAFFLLFFGYAISSCTFLAEKFYKRFWDKEKSVDIVEYIS